MKTIIKSKIEELLSKEFYCSSDELNGKSVVYYVPDDDFAKDDSVSLNYECEYLFNKDILSLNGLTGFENSLVFDETGFTSAKGVYIAKDKNRIIGVAGAAETSANGVWEIGVDVIEKYRNV